MRHHRIIPNMILSCVALLLSTSAAANPVNAERLRPKAVEPGFSGLLEGSFALASGNINSLDLSGLIRLQYQQLYPKKADASDTHAQDPALLRRQLFITSSGRFAQQDDKTFANQVFTHARLTTMWWPRLGSEVFVQHQFNEFLRLKLRALGGLGARAMLINDQALMLWAGTGYMLEYTQQSDLNPYTPGESTLEHRWTSYTAARAELFKSRLLLQNTLYVQPRFDKLSDLRILEELELMFKLTERLGLGLSLSILHDSAPPTAVAPTDIRQSTTFKLSF